jgi:hypothetical protein
MSHRGACLAELLVVRKTVYKPVMLARGFRAKALATSSSLSDSAPDLTP